MAETGWDAFPVAPQAPDPWAAFPEAPKPSKAGGIVNALGYGIAEGVPIVGPSLKRGAQKLQAGINSLRLGTPYADELKSVQDFSKVSDTEHPVAHTVGELTGGVVSTGGAGTTALGAKVLGLGGKTLPGAIWRGGVSGGAINALDATARDQDPVSGAGLGAAISAGAPVVGRVVSTIASPLTTAIRGLRDPAAEASRRVAGAVERDVASGTAGLTEPEFLAAQQAGHPVKLMDMGGETTRAVARSAANTSPEGRAILNREIDDTFAGQGSRTADWFKSGSHFPTDAARNQALAHVANNEIGPKYMAAMKDSAATPLWPNSEVRKIPGLQSLPSNLSKNHEALLSDLAELTQAPEMQSAIRLANANLRNWAVRDQVALRAANPQLRNFIVTPPKPFLQIVNGQTVMAPVSSASGLSVLNVPTLRYWDYIKRALDQMGTPTSKSYARTLRNNLDEIVPKYAEARAAAQPTKFFQGASDAHEAGQNFFRRGDKFDAADTQKALSSMSDTQRKLFQDGYAEAYINFIEKHPNRRNLLNEINKSPAATKEFETALGPQRAREFEARMRVEHIMDQARGAVQGNSTTARQLAELGLAGGVSALESGSAIPTDPQTALHAALVWGAARGHRVIDTRVARQAAQLLASNDPQRLKIGMQLLTRNSNLFGALRNGDAALASIAARGSLPALSN